MIRAISWQLSGRGPRAPRKIIAIFSGDMWQSVAIWQYVAIFMETSTAVHCYSRGAAAIPVAPAFASLPFAGSGQELSNAMINAFGI